MPPRERSGTGLWSRLLFDEARLLPLIALAGTFCVAAAWLLFSPEVILSRQMTWDLLFNLAGAWYLVNGGVAHVDFHDPVGSLYYWLTRVGFWISGPGISAFLTGQLVMTAGLFATAAAASVRRLPLLPAVVFVVFMCLLVIMPINVGELSNAFTFAMSYNSYCWSGLGILSLILFVAPRRPSAQAWPDLSVAALLLVGLYYLKMSCFIAAVVELGVALLVSAHMRSRRWQWSALGAAVLLNAVAPYNWAYLGDVTAAISTGLTLDELVDLLRIAVANEVELSLWAAALLAAIGLWRSGRASLGLPVAIAALVVEGLAVLSQNTQLRGMPLCMVIAFILYDRLRGLASGGDRRVATWLLAALLVIPVAGIGKEVASVGTYYRWATRPNALFVVTETNIRGLAVPLNREGLLDAFSTGNVDHTFLHRTRSVDTPHGLSQYEYVTTLLEAAGLFDDEKGRPGGIAVLDQVNPLPFMLGRRPPNGVHLWLAPEFPWPAPAAMFAEADHVLVPKFSTNVKSTEVALARYGSYVEEHFPVRLETRSWILRSRRNPR